MVEAQHQALHTREVDRQTWKLMTFWISCSRVAKDATWRWLITSQSGRLTQRMRMTMVGLVIWVSQAWTTRAVPSCKTPTQRKTRTSTALKAIMHPRHVPLHKPRLLQQVIDRLVGTTINAWSPPFQSGWMLGSLLFSVCWGWDGSSDWSYTRRVSQPIFSWERSS